jgi:adenylate kinase
MLRAAVAAGTPLGQQAEAIMNAGGLVSDDIMNGIVAERLAEADVVEHGVLLDGFPRTAGQADALASIFEEQGVELDAAINIDVAIEEVTARMMARGREDDTAEAIAERLNLYEEQTAPLLKWFAERGKLVVIDGLGEEDEVFGRVRAALGL